MTRTSRMCVVTSPARFGWVAVDVLFGTVRDRADRVTVLAGDAVRNLETGEVRVFVSREGTALVTEAL